MSSSRTLWREKSVFQPAVLKGTRLRSTDWVVDELGTTVGSVTAAGRGPGAG